MKILIVGSGGREHALAWKAAQSHKTDTIYVAPGNAGTAREAKTQNVDIEATDIAGLVEFARDRQIDLTIVGPEAPLAKGIVDAFRTARLRCFGPTEAAARLESSKAYCKDFLARHNIPTASYGVFSGYDGAAAYIRDKGAPIVIKADGLAAGKGVVVAKTEDEALNAVRHMLAGNIAGDAGHRVIIEEYLEGEEISFTVMANESHFLPLVTSQDHKTRDDGDRGPNTGGMGAYSPAPVASEQIQQRIVKEIISPTLRAMRDEGTPYTGFLYAGLIVTRDGTPKVLEFNCRLGDPETEPLMMRLRSDIIALCEATIDGRLGGAKADWDTRPALGVVMASGGYPGKYQTGETISGLPASEAGECKVFHAGTTERNGQVVTDGGRVLCVTALGDSVAQAQERVYKTVKGIRWPNVHYRTDIGYRAIQREGGQ